MEETRGEEIMEEEAAEVEIWKYVFGFVNMAVVKCAIELGIAEAIEKHGSPMTISELSSALSCAPSLLHRIMRFPTHHKFFKEKPTSQDDECIQILKNCREAIPKDKGKVLIFKAIVEEEVEGNKFKSVRLMLDMVMMAHTNKGKERTLKEWDFILGLAGFSRYNIKRIQAVQSLIEAFP